MSRPQLPCSFALPYSDCLFFSVCCCHSSQEANEASKTDAVLPAVFLYPHYYYKKIPWAGYLLCVIVHVGDWVLCRVSSIAIFCRSRLDSDEATSVFRII